MILLLHFLLKPCDTLLFNSSQWSCVSVLNFTIQYFAISCIIETYKLMYVPQSSQLFLAPKRRV